MIDPRETAALAVIHKIDEMLMKALEVDDAYPAAVHIVIIEDGFRVERWAGSHKRSAFAEKYSRMKAEISFRTKKSVYDVLHNHQYLLEPDERKLVPRRGLWFSERPKLHAGGVFHKVCAVGVAGAGPGRDCLFASNIAVDYVRAAHQENLRAA